MKKILTISIIVFVLSNIILAQPMSGTYRVGTGEVSPNFELLSAAVTSLNTNGVNGNVVFEISSDITETVNIGLIHFSDFTVTIRPDADVDRTITFDKSTDNAGPSGAFCIGIGMGLAWTDLSPTKNVIIDGYAVGGSTRRLKIATALTQNGLNGPILLMDDCSNIQIKNSIIHHLGASTGSSNYGIYLRVNTLYGTKKMPSNVTIENNIITATQNTASQAIGIYANAAPVSNATNVVIKNNIINARTRGVFLYYVDGLDITGNEFHIIQTANGVLSSAVMGNAGQTGNINVFDNKFIELKTANSTSGAFGMRAIIASGGGTWYIHNNFFTGFDKTSTTAGETMLQGIRCASTCYIRYNTFFMNPLTNKPSNVEIPTDVQGAYCSINIAAGTPEIKNNIFISNDDAFYNFLIRGTNGGASDYNVMYLKAGNTFARFNGTYATFDDYKSGTGKDANSVSKDVNFVDATDLHLTGASIGDVDLIADPSVGITTDIDGDTRHATFPYMGADENTGTPLPVELTSFSATVIGSKVKLSWRTETEVNNYGFEILRSAQNDNEWTKLGFIEGYGTSNSPKNYAFTDESVSLGKYSYRLKQIDIDGTIEFSKSVEVDLGIPKEFQLSQNYPNPFNPTTKIHYTLPVDAQVTLQIYSITGELMESLVSEHQSQGSYTIDFDGRNYASGTYLYRLIANDFIQTKKMILIK